jgi:hypothetical protein
VFAAVAAGDIFEVIGVSLAAAVVVSTTFSVVVLGGARSTEARRDGQASTALLWAALAVIAFAAFAVTVVLGVHIMLSKS